MTGDDAAKVANSVIEGLKTQPLALALIVMNIIFLTVGYLVWNKHTELRSEYIASIMKACMDVTSKPSGFGPGAK